MTVFKKIIIKTKEMYGMINALVFFVKKLVVGCGDNKKPLMKKTAAYEIDI